MDARFMSRLLVSQYQTEVEKIIRYGGSRKETAIRTAFQNLLNEYCKTRDFLLIPELEYKTRNNKVVYPDGTVKDALRLDWGYWESKDQYDNLNEEIDKKLSKGYPDSNILFEDSQTAVLIQSGDEVFRVSMKDADGLDEGINAFINYVRPEVKDFREAIEVFKEDLPTILNALRIMIQGQEDVNSEFKSRRNRFWELCKESINPEISLLDVQEMLIQHILSEDIFVNIFSESQFHRENNIARELQQIIETFFTGNTRRNTLSSIERYYAVIRRTSANIYNHQEKQKFLKAIYENFYKAYNPKAADRLGIVYTPNEIVRFLIESSDYLVHKSFGKLLSDSGVEILDPATGTGTFITELIEYLPIEKLEYKYKNEIHCNEIEILPYYIANLNIEYTYKQKTGKYEEFENICLVDTLEHTTFEGKQGELFRLSVENTERIKRQNEKTISVIICNPPYNANQVNENDNNKNRQYPAIDKLIKDTYVKQSTAQKTKVYDMYSRFFRWATSRLNDNGVLAFVTNSSFINARTFDGFRKVVTDEFSEIYIIDLGGDVRANPKLSGTKHNVFGIQAGVAISFMVKRRGGTHAACKIFYARCPEFATAEEKLKFLANTQFNQVSFEHITPDKNHNWLNITNNDFNDLIPVINKKSNDTQVGFEGKSVFSLYSNGVSTNRDEWVYDLNATSLKAKAAFFVDEYNHEVSRWIKYKKANKVIEVKSESNPVLDQFLQERNIIKWSKMIKRDKLRKEKKGEFEKARIIKACYRPYSSHFLYFDYIPIDLPGQQLEIFSHGKKQIAKPQNLLICFSGLSFSKPFQTLATNYVSSLDLLEKTVCLPLYRFNEHGERIDNITDWGLEQFQRYYNNFEITKKNIFYYIYAVFHNPRYCQKYEFNLKREFPRLPFYQDFYQWVNWGKELMDLHINYETVAPYLLKRVDIPTSEDSKRIPKTKLKADKTKGIITLDDVTTLEGIPKEAWDYKLGNRSALEWILDQYKEKKPKDPTIAAKFNTYRFADYKEQVIDLLQRVCTVSVETMRIVQAMPDE
jgi:predicted helicase